MMTVLVITQLSAMFFNTYISSKIGVEGMGIFRLAATVYAFAATIAVSGINLAVTRLVTEFAAFGKYSQARASVRLCMVISLAVSSAAGAALFIFSDRIGTDFLGDARTVISLKVLSFSLPFMAVSACFRGYFMAMRSVVKASSEQLFEQIVQIIVCVNLIDSFAAGGVRYACCAVAVGMAAAEAASCVYSAVLYCLDIRKHKISFNREYNLSEYRQENNNSASGKNRRLGSDIARLARIALPVTGSSCLRSGLGAFENSLIPSGLQKFGFSSASALGEYGKITGMAMPVLMFPAVCLAPISALIIPEMSEAKALSRTQDISRITRKILRLTSAFIVPITAVFLLFGDTVARLLYHREDVGVYIRILSLTIPFSYLDKVVDGMLKGLDQQIYYFTYNIIDSTLRVVLALILIPVMGVKGVIIIMFVSVILNSVLSLQRLLRVAGGQRRTTADNVRRKNAHRLF